jgi:lipopolysaccharide/colanic/teichoic acid biosynthesis glycosyltransferase
MKRLFDVLAASFGLLLASPLILPVMFLVWWHDRHSPLYVAPRVGKGGRIFRMVKLRTMTPNADKAGVDSTSADDRRITPIGHFIRRYKLDEITQLWDVLKGYMSLVGPRPNVKRETDLYTEEETRLLSLTPGITDFSSIVFSDEGEILKDKTDPDIAYNQLIRPWKSRLGLFYVDRSNFWLDVRLVLLTVLALYSRQSALVAVSRMLEGLGAPAELVRVALRQDPLIPTAPPGAAEIVMSRDGHSAQAEFQEKTKAMSGGAKAATGVSPVSSRLQPRLLVAASVASLTGVAVTAVVLLWHVPSHPYVNIEAPGKMRITFLLQSRPEKEQCEASLAKVVNAVRLTCPECKIVAQNCLDELNSNQSQMLGIEPLKSPSARLADGGVVMFESDNPVIAATACREGEHQAAVGRKLNIFKCHLPGQVRRML